MTFSQKIIRAHPITCFFPALGSLILIIAPFFFLIPLFEKGVLGYIVFCFFLGLGIIYGLRVFLIWRSNSLLISPKELIVFVKQGFFSSQTKRIDYETIKDITVEKTNFFQTLFNFGSICLSLYSQEKPLIISRIPKPEKVQELILSCQRKEPQSFDLSSLSQQELVDLICQLRDYLGEEKLRQILREEK